MKTVILMICFALLAACSSSSSGTNAPATGQKTDYSVCEGGQPPANIEGTWTRSGNDNGIDLTSTIAISKRNLTFTMTCSKDGLTASPTGTSASHYTQDSLVVENSISVSKTITLKDGTSLSCDLDFQPMTISYKFKGSCLVLKAPGEDEIILVPAR